MKTRRSSRHSNTLQRSLNIIVPSPSKSQKASIKNNAKTGKKTSKSSTRSSSPLGSLRVQSTKKHDLRITITRTRTRKKDLFSEPEHESSTDDEIIVPVTSFNGTTPSLSTQESAEIVNVTKRTSPRKSSKLPKLNSNSLDVSPSDEIKDDDEDETIISSDVLYSLCRALSSDKIDHLYGYEAELKNVVGTLKNMLVNKDSNSLLICGGRGSGKTALIEFSLRQANADTRNVTIIKLNGLIHGNDLSTMRIITKEFDIEGTELPLIISEMRRKCESTKRSVVIVLDEFDVFCRRHQTLLYNLLDLSQQSNSICIIGLTTRLDCLELLEKRVKSRMNQRIVNLISPFKDEMDFKNFAEKHLLKNEMKITGSFRKRLNEQFSKNKSVKSLKRFLFQELTVLQGKTATKIQSTRDPMVSIVASLSNLELSIVFLAFKFTAHNGTDIFNCINLSKLFHEIPTQMNMSKKLLFKILNNLIDCGLVVVAASARKTIFHITEWTPLALTLDKLHLNEALKRTESSLPMDMKQLLSIQREM